MDRRQLLASAPGIAAIGMAAGGRSAVAQDQPDMMRGVNLAGAEFGQTFPGSFGKDYTYPDAAAFARFKSYGFNCIRLPFRWERLQPDLFGPFDEAEWRRLDDAISAARRAGQTLILDLHNFARRRVRSDGFKADHMIGSGLVPANALTAIWSELARRTAHERHVVHGIMNEPADIAARLWLEIANPTMAAIRKAGATQLILAPGVDWSGAHSWYAAGNTLMARLVDPGHNMAIEVHQYLDSDSSGRSGRSVSATIGSERIEAFQAWAREHRFKAFLGEFGAGSDATSIAALTDLLIEVEQNRDVWIGWTGWAAGPWWPPDEPLQLEPNSAGMLPPQTLAMARFTKPGSVPDDVIAGSSIDLDFTRERYHGVRRLGEAISVTRNGQALSLTRAGALVAFERGAARRTDLGVAIDGGGRNHLSGVEPVEAKSGRTSNGPVLTRAIAVVPGIAAPSYLLAAPGMVSRWRPAAADHAALMREAQGTCISFGLHVLSDPLKSIVLTLTLGAASAEIDLARRTARMIAGSGAVAISGSGLWRRTTLTVPAEALPPDGEITIAKRGAATDHVAVGAAMLAAGTSSSAYAVRARPAEEVIAGRALQTALQTTSFSLMIETRSLTAFPIDLPLLSGSAGLILQRRRDGALSSPLAGGIATRAAGPDRWQQRRRSVLSIDSRKNRLTLAATGDPAVSVTRALSAVPQGPFRIGGDASGRLALDGYVTRIVIIPNALDETGAALLAGQ